MSASTNTAPEKIIIRLPDGWRDVIKAEAKKSHRTMTGEVVAAIELAMSLKGVSLDPAP